MTPLATQLLFLFLGWVLGLASPIIVDHLKRLREEREIRAALQAELGELRYRFAIVVLTIEMRLGLAERLSLTWLRPIVAEYEGVNRSEHLLKYIEQTLALSDEQIKILNDATKAAPERTMGLRKYSAPLLESKLSSLSSMDIELQSRLMEVRVHLNFFNEEVDQSRYFHQLTFTTSESEFQNDQAVRALIETQKNAAARARTIVENIDKIRW